MKNSLCDEVISAILELTPEGRKQLLEMLKAEGLIKEV